MYAIHNQCFGIDLRNVNHVILAELILALELTDDDLQTVLGENDLFEAYDLSGASTPIQSFYSGDDDSPVILGFEISSHAAFDIDDAADAKLNEFKPELQKKWENKFKSITSKKVRAVLDKYHLKPNCFWVTSTS